MLRGLFAKRAGIAPKEPGETERVKALALALLARNHQPPHPEVLGEAEPRRTRDRSACFEAPLRGAPQHEEVGGISNLEITVSEIVCLDPDCPGTETVILIMSAGAKTRAAKVAKPARDVSEPDLRAALTEAGCEVRT
jgi:hypothetical protein